MTNFTFHEGLLYPKQSHTSNPVITNWPAIENHRFLMAHFKLRPQAGFLIPELPKFRPGRFNFKSTISIIKQKIFPKFLYVR
jgi:hypothetical protein